MFKNCSLLMTSVLIVLLISVMGTANSQALDPVSRDTDIDVSNHGINELTAGIRTLPPTKQKAFFPIYLANKIPINLPGFWKLVNNPDDAWTMLRFFNEPYSPEILDVLERVLPAASKEKKLRIGAILYRYDRPSGYAALSKILDEDTDQKVLLTFALNKDRTKLPQILKALSAPADTQEKFLRQLSLISRLSDWHDPQIAAALYAKFQERHDNIGLGLFVAAQDSVEALPLVQTIYFSSAPDSTTKVSAAVALVKLDGAHTQVPFLFLTVGLKHPKPGVDTSLHRLVACEDFGQLKIKAAAPFLREEIVSYLSVEASGRSPQPEPLARPLELALAATDSLAEIDDVASVPLVTHLLRHLRAMPDSDVYSIRVTDALLQLNAPRKEIDKLMGERWVQRRIQIRQLKRLPFALLPSVRNF